jgi:hypothetical protein
MPKTHPFTKEEMRAQEAAAREQAAIDEEKLARQARRQRYSTQGVDIDLVDREILRMEKELESGSKRRARLARQDKEERA